MVNTHGYIPQRPVNTNMMDMALYGDFLCRFWTRRRLRNDFAYGTNAGWVRSILENELNSNRHMIEMGRAYFPHLVGKPIADNFEALTAYLLMTHPEDAEALLWESYVTGITKLMAENEKFVSGCSCPLVRQVHAHPVKTE